MVKKLYMAGGLFNIGERAHNATLEKGLFRESGSRGIDLKIISPQRRALDRFITEENRFDVSGIVEDCKRDVASSDYALFNLDGPDADSGTAVEYGIVLGLEMAGLKNIPKIITYRTDFRTDFEKEVGVNAMLMDKSSEHIYFPCFAIEIPDLKEHYKRLAQEIVNRIEIAA